MLKHKSNLWGANGLAYSVGMRSIAFFCQYYLQDYFVPKPDNLVRPLAPVHFEIWDELEKIYIHNEYDKEEFILPRGCAKTTIIDMALSCWLHCYKKSIYTIVLANRELDAVNFVADTKKAIQNPYIKQTFGELVNRQKRVVNNLELELDNDTKIACFSSGSSVRGTKYPSSKGVFRPTTVIADDYISESDVLTDESKQKKYERWLKEVEESGDEQVIRNGQVVKQATKFLVLGTPLANGDFIDRIKKNPEYKVFQRSVVDFDPDEYFNSNEHWLELKRIFMNNKSDNPEADAYEYYQKHESLMKFSTIWEKYNCFKLALKYYNKRFAFMSEYMCDCASIGEKWFKSTRVMTQEEIEQITFKNTLLTIDCAGIKNKDSRNSDYFAFVMGSVGSNGFKYVRKGEILKFKEFEDYINHVINLLIEFKDCNNVFIEKNTFLGLDANQIKQEIDKHPELRNRHIKIINESQRQSKDIRISTIIDSVNNGRIIFCEERVVPEFIAQIMDFAGQRFSKHDDAPDALAEFSARIETLEETKYIRFLDKSLLFGRR